MTKKKEQHRPPGTNAREREREREREKKKNTTDPARLR